jgi:metallopeptidase MepB
MGSAFKKPPQAPPLFTHTPESLIDDTTRFLASSKALQDRIAKDITTDTATFHNAILPFAQDDNEVALQSHLIGFYQSVSTDAKLRDASTEAEKQMDKFGIETSMREDLFQLCSAAYNKQQNDSALDPESQKLLQKDYKDYIKMGLGIPAGPKRDRFKAIKERLSELGITFQKTLNEDDGGLWLTPEELKGVPADVVDGLKKGEEGSENAGKLWLTFKYPDLFPTLKYCKNEDVRRRLFVANENKCAKNVPLFKEAIVLRDESARLLGYPDHATFRIEDKMAKTPKTVNDFLGDLRERLAPGGVKEIEKLKELKKAEGLSNDTEHYYLWDHRYFDTLMLEKDYQLDQNKISEYFPLQTSISGMLNIFEELFGLQFIEVAGAHRDEISPSGKGSDIIWHPDVQVFAVWDDASEGNGFVGYLYLDLFPRDGKYGHAANFNLQPGFLYPNGTRRYPATALVCNFSKPTAKKPSLLKHDEVVTLFHELGHGIHDLVGRTIYSRFHGTATVRDFVEAPSQMLENWCWTPSQLHSLSKHWSYLSPEYFAVWKEQQNGTSTSQPSEHLPESLINSIINTRHVNAALFNLRQLHFGIYDMTVHTPKSHEDVVAIKTGELYNSLRHSIVKLAGPESLPGGDDNWGHGEATFGHLIGGYDAGYYGYLSSQVYSADMFASVFAKDPMNGKDGRRYRHTVLERGGSRDEFEILKEFLGREPSSEAFYRELGIGS